MMIAPTKRFFQLVLLCAACTAISAPFAFAGQGVYALPPLETNIIGNGNIPQATMGGTISVRTFVNGSEIPNFYFQGAPTDFGPVAYTTDDVVFNSHAPISSRIVVVETVAEGDSYTEYVLADITTTHNPQTGQVSATGEGLVTTGSASLTGITNPAQTSTGSNGSFRLSAADNIADMSIQSCLVFSGSTLRVCHLVSAPSQQMVPTPPMAQ